MILTEIAQSFTDYFDNLAVKETPYGCYRGKPDGEVDLYASLDVALMRVIMAEDFTQSLSEQQREEWIAYINSYADADGTYQQFGHHSALHANGMVIGALGPLGGQQAYPVSLYDEFSDPDQVVAWLEQVNWAAQWSASHLFWGGMHCYSMHPACSANWKNTVFNWLDEHLDPETGWWCKGIAHTDRHQALGGSVHILPIYQHHQRAFPCVEALVDSTLALQLDNATWLQGHAAGISYLELDALYVFAFASKMNPTYRKVNIANAVQCYANHVDAFWKSNGIDYFEQRHAHEALAFIGIAGLLQQILPERYPHDQQWTDIFSDPRLYLTEQVNRGPVVSQQ